MSCFFLPSRANACRGLYACDSLSNCAQPSTGISARLLIMSNRRECGNQTILVKEAGATLNKGAVMLSQNRRFSVLSLVVLAGVMVLPGCASRKYVRLQTQTVGPAIQEISNAVKENAERIDTVDRRAQQGITAAGAADAKATQAQQAAQAADTAAQAADRKADSANQGVQQATNRMTTLETRVSNFNLTDNYTVSETQTVTFALNSSTLSKQAMSTLDKIAGDVSGQRTGYMLELQGFTDITGSAPQNLSLSQRRAESVERYLVSKNVPLFRTSILGLGTANPVADNKTAVGRDQNRRVEIRVLKAVIGRQTN
jgi:outer membrane protein OmpA-like peptidoglycan-associated protein